MRIDGTPYLLELVEALEKQMFEKKYRLEQWEEAEITVGTPQATIDHYEKCKKKVAGAVSRIEEMLAVAKNEIEKNEQHTTT